MVNFQKDFSSQQMAIW